MLARKWPKLMLKWEEMESKFPNYRTQGEKNEASKRINIYAVCLVVCSLVEHILSLLHLLDHVQICDQDKREEEAFFMHRYSEVFGITSYALWKAILATIIHIVANFTWNYMSLFIVMISIGLSSRFKQLNSEMERIKGEVIQNMIQFKILLFLNLKKIL